MTQFNFDEIININNDIIDINQRLIHKINILENDIKILQEDLKNINQSYDSNHNSIPFITLILSLIFPLWFLSLFGSLWIISNNKWTRYIGCFNFILAILYLIKNFYNPWWL
jgi:hypothetical protein